MNIKIAFVAFSILLAACHNNHEHHSSHSHDHSTEHNHTASTEHIHTASCDHTDTNDHNHEHEQANNHDHDHEHEHELYGVIKIAHTHFGDVIRVGGELLPTPKNDQLVVASRDGLVFFAQSKIQEGTTIKANQKLFSLASGNLINNNLEVEYLQAKAEYEKSKTDFERAKKLVADTIISDNDFLNLKLAYENSELAFSNVQRNYTVGKQQIVAPTSGFVKRIYVAEGEYVQAGDPLMVISDSKRLTLKAEIPQSALHKMHSIQSAKFYTPYNKKVYSTTNLNGELVSWGKSAAENSFYIPLFFEIDNQGDLIPGTFVDIYLKTKTDANSLAIPRTAIMEEFGNYYVYIDCHEEWEKRYVTIGGTDGELTKITDGLAIGEMVATKNVSRIKLSLMSGDLPAHAHAH